MIEENRIRWVQENGDFRPLIVGRVPASRVIAELLESDLANKQPLVTGIKHGVADITALLAFGGITGLDGEFLRLNPEPFKDRVNDTDYQQGRPIQANDFRFRVLEEEDLHWPDLSSADPATFVQQGNIRLKQLTLFPPKILDHLQYVVLDYTGSRKLRLRFPNYRASYPNYGGIVAKALSHLLEMHLAAESLTKPPINLQEVALQAVADVIDRYKEIPDPYALVQSLVDPELIRSGYVQLTNAGHQ